MSAVTEKTAVNEDLDSMPVRSSLGKDPVCQLSIRKVQDDLLPRISGTSGAQEAQFGDWPNMCIVLKESEFNGDSFDLYQCGASLIAPGIVLTAAHCVEYEYLLIVENMRKVVFSRSVFLLISGNIILFLKR